GLMQVRTGARMATTGVSALVLIGSLLFLLVGILPRANAVSNLQDNIKPFAKAVRDNCKTPLDKVNADYVAVERDALSATALGDDYTAMRVDLTTLTADAQQLKVAGTALQSLNSPDSKYDDLLARCKTDVAAQADFLTNDSGAKAIQLPAALGGAKVSAISLVSLGVNYGAAVAAYNAAVATATAAGVTPPPFPSQLPPQGTVGPALFQAFDAIIKGSKDAQLTTEGDQLQKDIRDTLTNNLSPFGVNLDKVLAE